MANGQSNGLPWQVKAVLVLGTTTAIACFLVWFLANTVMNALVEIRASVLPLAPHVESTQQLGATLASIERDHRESNTRIEGYMRLICIQGAKTDDQRQRCLSVQ